MTNPSLASLVPPDVDIEAPAKTLAERLWDFDWCQYFPREIAPDCLVERSNFTEFREFCREHLGQVYGASLDGRFLLEPLSQKKTRYYELVGDFTRFRSGGKTVGMYIGTSVDWSTYYLRSIVLLPEVQGRGWFKTFIAYYVECLEKIGIDRIETDISPSNPVSQKVITSLGFYPTGTLLTERWGALVRYTRFARRDAAQIFLDQFCLGPESQSTAKPVRPGSS